MGKLRHIAFISRQPKTLSDFYQTIFGFEEVRVFPSGSRMVIDGLFNLAFLQQRNVQLEIVGTHAADGSEADQTQGIAHYGFVVDDLGKALAKLPAELKRGESPQISAGVPAPRPAEVRFIDPWGNNVDISSRGFLGREEERLPGVRLACVQVPNPDGASEFYERQFDLELLRREPDGSSLLTDGTVSLRLTRERTLGRGGIQYFGIQVDRIDRIRKRLEEAGFRLSRLPDPGRFEIRDPEGNRVLLSEESWAA